MTLPTPTLEETEAALDELFARIEQATMARDVGRLVAHFTELPAALEGRGTAGVAAARRRVKAWERRRDDGWKDVAAALQLQVDLGEGHELLWTMLRARRADQFDDVVEAYVAIEKLVARMRAQNRDEFQRSAEAIAIRGKALRDDVWKRQSFRNRFPVHLHAVVVDPRPGRRSFAVVELEGTQRVVEEGRALLDGDGEPTPVTLVKVDASAIRVKLDDYEMAVEFPNPE